MMFFHFFIWYLVFPPYPAYQRKNRKTNEGSEKQTGTFGTDDNGNNIHIIFSCYVRAFADSEFISSLVVLADAAFDYVVPAKPILCGGVLIPDSPQSEKANLISVWWKVRQYVTLQMLHKAITLINTLYTVGPDISNISYIAPVTFYSYACVAVGFLLFFLFCIVLCRCVKMNMY